MDDATGLAEALLGLDGFRVLSVEETPSEVIVIVETTADLVGCLTCSVRAVAKDRLRVDIRDLPCFGRPARLVWMKRRCRCADPECCAKTWIEDTEHVAPRAVLTLRAGAEATRQVGEIALPVAVVARELGVCWWTVMDAVVLHGTPLVDDPNGSRRSASVVDALGTARGEEPRGALLPGTEKRLSERAMSDNLVEPAPARILRVPSRESSEALPHRIKPSSSASRNRAVRPDVDGTAGNGDP